MFAPHDLSSPRYLTPLIRTATAAVIVGSAVVACGGDSPTAGGARPDGPSLYAANCASCHGADLRGTDLGPSQLSVVYEPNHHSDDSYRSAITNGAGQHHWTFGDMLPVEGLTDIETDAIIAFIREEQERQGFEPYPP